MENTKYSEEDIIGFSEAYDVYELFSEEERRNIPIKFVNAMKQYAKDEYRGKIKKIEDVKKDEISRNGLIKINFMCQYI